MTGVWNEGEMSPRGREMATSSGEREERRPGLMTDRLAVQDCEMQYMNAWLKRCVFNLDLNRESVSEPPNVIRKAIPEFWSQI